MAELEAAEKRRKEIEQQQLEGERVAREKKLAEQKERQRIADAISAYRKQQDERYEYWENVQKEEDAYRSELEKTQKKLKNLRKKLRDIVDLENRAEEGATISLEQKEKIRKKEGISAEIEVVEESERTMLANPPALINPLPRPDENPKEVEMLIESKGLASSSNSYTSAEDIAKEVSVSHPLPGHALMPVATGTERAIEVSSPIIPQQCELPIGSGASSITAASKTEGTESRLCEKPATIQNRAVNTGNVWTRGLKVEETDTALRALTTSITNTNVSNEDKNEISSLRTQLDEERWETVELKRGKGKKGTKNV